MKTIFKYFFMACLAEILLTLVSGTIDQVNIRESFRVVIVVTIAFSLNENVVRSKRLKAWFNGLPYRVRQGAHLVGSLAWVLVVGCCWRIMPYFFLRLFLFIFLIFAIALAVENIRDLWKGEEPKEA